MFGLTDDIITMLCAQFAKNERIGEVVIFGSRAKGSHTSGSDIDLALKGSNLTHNDVLEISFAIDDFGMLYEVDMVIYNEALDVSLKEHIDCTGKLLYTKETGYQR